MALKDHPKLHAAFNDLMAEKTVIVEQTGPLREKRDKLRNKIAPLEVELRGLNKEIAVIERPDLVDIDIQLSAIAKAAGGVSIKAETG